MSGDRELDVVVFGATGFAGRLVAGYLAGHAPGGVRIGLAGRSGRRMADVRAGLGAAASAWPLLVADSADPVSVAALARTARVVVSTVGPYRASGLALVQACAEAGTDYADLTGEVLFIRDSIDRCHDAAAAAGARIVHCCGFDSIPSDLGVLGLHQIAHADDAGDLQDTTLVVTALRGGVSGGTLASMMDQQEEVRASTQRRRVVSDPYALSPDRAAEPDLGDERDPGWARYDGSLRMWTGPFAMAGINTRVVRRSNALQGWAYGRRFRYREVTGFGAGPAAPLLAATVSAGMKAAGAGLAFGPSRAMLSQLLPAPGQGPGEKTRRTGYFRIQIHTRTSAGARYLATIEAQGDPGYAATSVMLGETALCLALDRNQLPDRAGVLTPATAMGAALAARLRSAGHTLATRQITQLPW
ncbi:MAG: saccharopine dehydrogenase NADP-binding domain-containing protein [Streptosporangiaceae bacterium]